ncbi:hypothetical protein KGP36_02820 [Patescibacteria group bacterium]|nr:hypothetical protein [Patescibacteria group bacterium]
MKKDRKAKIEWTLREARKVAGDNGYMPAAQAWERLCEQLEVMIKPEARPPRFKGLLDAIWKAATNES